MSIREQMDEAAQRLREEEVARKERRRLESRRRLATIVKTKIKTSFIGALAKFEEHFGDRLAMTNSRHDGPLTPEEADLAELWQQCRTEILDLGNHQIRAVEKELEQYEVDWLRYQAVFQLGRPQGDNKE